MATKYLDYFNLNGEQLEIRDKVARETNEQDNREILSLQQRVGVVETKQETDEHNIGLNTQNITALDNKITNVKAQIPVISYAENTATITITKGV